MACPSSIKNLLAASIIRLFFLMSSFNSLSKAFIFLMIKLFSLFPMALSTSLIKKHKSFAPKLPNLA